ncbi:hypothetical protein [Streptomyces sp. NBC_01589]|uniref:hypothetical protein n=1 Tax=unclassified Streptomyces TaxID=2593676 RepID=UPI003862E0F2
MLHNGITWEHLPQTRLRLGHDVLARRSRKAIRAHLDGEKTAGHRLQGPDTFVPVLDYCRQRLSEDPYLWATALFRQGGRAGAFLLAVRTAHGTDRRLRPDRHRHGGIGSGVDGGVKFRLSMTFSACRWSM